jgi:DNA-nicking Smr family endonuclease
MRSQIKIEGKIDLHGYTQDQAFEFLSLFLKNAYITQKRQVLIVTGKGSYNNPGVLKTMLPRWLEYTELKRYISDYSQAPIEFGGGGAMLVKLKKITV